KRGLLAIDVELHAPAVELNLVQPLRPGRRDPRQCRSHWLDEWNFAQHAPDVGTFTGLGNCGINFLLAKQHLTLLAMRGDASAPDRVFPITERRINYILKAIVKRAGGNPGTSPHWLRHAHASHAIDNGAPITLVSQTLGHADLRTTSVYAHARPNESSSRFLKQR